MNSVTLTYSVDILANKKVRIHIEDPARTLLRNSNHPNVFIRSARFHKGYVIVSSDYILGHGLTPEEAWADAVFVVNSDSLTHERLCEVWA